MKVILTETTKEWKANTLADLNKGVLTICKSGRGYLLTPNDKVAYKVVKEPKVKGDYIIIIFGLSNDYSLSDLYRMSKDELKLLLSKLTKV